MDNEYQIFLYIILGVIYVLSGLFKAKRKRERGQTGEFESEQPKRKEITFEDLLKEFTGQEPQKREATRTQSESYEFEREMPNDDEIDKVYQASIREAQSLEELDASKLRHSVEFEKFEEFKKVDKNELLEEIMEDLSDGHGLKKAIIYKEILDRKY